MSYKNYSQNKMKISFSQVIEIQQILLNHFLHQQKLVNILKNTYNCTSFASNNCFIFNRFFLLDRFILKVSAGGKLQLEISAFTVTLTPGQYVAPENLTYAYIYYIEYLYII